jgi:Protein required for attachment to host cells
MISMPGNSADLTGRGVAYIARAGINPNHLVDDVLNARNVVCDGRKAIILENVSDKVFPNLKTKEVFEHASPATRALGADAPGRTHQSVGRSGSAVEQTDWHDEAERAFLVSLASRLDSALTKGETGKLNIVASPRALGMIRHCYSEAVRNAIRA